MRIRTLIILISAFFTLVVSGCGSGGGDNSSNNSVSATSSVSASEVWTTVGGINSKTTINKDATGTLSSSGDWEISAQGYIISCPFQNGTATVTKTNLSFKASGVSEKAMGGDLAGVVYPKFDISGTGTYENGVVTSGTFTVSFSSTGTALLAVGDINGVSSLITRLQSDPNPLTMPISQSIWGRFDLATQQILADPNSLSSQRETALVKGLNGIIKSGSIYDQNLFAGVTLRSETMSLIKLITENPPENSGSLTTHLNRLILEDIYAQIPGNTEVIIPSFSGVWQPIRQRGNGITFVAPVGTYAGTFSGSDSGTWQLIIDNIGSANGTLTSNAYKKTYDFFGNYNMDGSLTLQSSSTPDGPTYFTGNLDSTTGRISGTWKNPNPKSGKSGSFSGSRN